MSQVKLLKIGANGLPSEMDQAVDEITLKSFTAEEGSSKTEITANYIAITGEGGAPIIPVDPSHLVVKKYVDDEIAAEALARSTGDADTLTAAKAYTDLAIAGATVEIAQMRFVAKNGNDSTGNGSLNKPYASVAAALNSITDASPTKRYGIKIQPGAYTETSVALKANVFLVGDSQDLVTITGPISMHSSFSGSADNRSGLSNLRLNSAADFDWSTVTSAAGKIYLQECVFVSTVRMYGHNNAIAQAQMQACEFFGAVTISGINVGIANDNRHYAAVNLQQHPNGGMATILSMHGGAIQAKVTATTAVNDFNRRCAIFAFGTYIDELEVNGAASYADLSDASVPRFKERLTAPNNGNVVYLNSNIPYKTNEKSFGDVGRQYLYNFSYVHASTESDLYLISMGAGYSADSAGRSIFLEADSYGLNPNVNGGDINLITAAVSGTGVRGKIKLSGRELDVDNQKIINLVDPTENQHGATKKYVDDKVAALVNAAPETLDTLKELADALGNDANFASTVSSSLGDLDTRLDTLEGTGPGSLYQTLVDAKAYTDSQIAANKDQLVSLVAGEALVQGELVAINASGQAVKGDPSTSALSKIVGSAESSVGIGESVQVRIMGKMSGLSGIVSGERYFLSSNGALSSSPPVTSGHFIVQAGFGVSSSEVVLLIQNFGQRS